MVWEDVSQDISFTLPENVTLQTMNDMRNVQDYQEIFSIAFDKDLEATKQKF
jgi:hypothetical protein